MLPPPTMRKRFKMEVRMQPRRFQQEIIDKVVFKLQEVQTNQQGNCV
jgi:hypothetical protein